MIVFVVFLNDIHSTVKLFAEYCQPSVVVVVFQYIYTYKNNVRCYSKDEVVLQESSLKIH